MDGPHPQPVTLAPGFPLCVQADDPPAAPGPPVRGLEPGVQDTAQDPAQPAGDPSDLLSPGASPRGCREAELHGRGPSAREAPRISRWLLGTALRRPWSPQSHAKPR